MTQVFIYKFHNKSMERAVNVKIQVQRSLAMPNDYFHVQFPPAMFPCVQCLMTSIILSSYFILPNLVFDCIHFTKLDRSFPQIIVETDERICLERFRNETLTKRVQKWNSILNFRCSDMHKLIKTLRQKLSSNRSLFLPMNLVCSDCID